MMTYEIGMASSWETWVRERGSRYGRGHRRRPRLLLVEDDALNRSVSARVLAELFMVTAVANGEEALARLRLEPFEIVVTDYRMPSMTGIELLELVRLLEPRVRRVLTSGASIPGLAGYIGSGIVERFLLKPVDLRTALKDLSGEDRREEN
jgi:CheY-like chemotaxis protein